VTGVLNTLTLSDDGFLEAFETIIAFGDTAGHSRCYLVPADVLATTGVSQTG